MIDRARAIVVPKVLRAQSRQYAQSAEGAELLRRKMHVGLWKQSVIHVVLSASNAIRNAIVIVKLRPLAEDFTHRLVRAGPVGGRIQQESVFPVTPQSGMHVDGCYALRPHEVFAEIVLIHLRDGFQTAARIKKTLRVDTLAGDHREPHSGQAVARPRVRGAYTSPVPPIRRSLLLPGLATIELSASQIGKLSATPEPAVDEGVTGKVKRWWSQNTDIKQGFEELKEVAGRATEYMIKLMVVFVVPTIVLPLLLLCALLKLRGMLAVLPGRKR